MGTRGENRHKKKVESKQEAWNKLYLKNLTTEYSNLIDSIMDGYCQRLNRHLSKVSPEHLAEIGYDHIDIAVSDLWEVPTEKVIAQTLATRKHKLDPEEKVYFFRVARRHMLKGAIVEEQNIFANMSYKSEGIETNNEVEIITKCSFIGSFAEKGIEYLEAERQTKKIQVNA